MTIDLVLDDAHLWKYVDETTVTERNTNVQEIVNRLEDQSRANKFQLNCDKCKELRISFAKNKIDLP